LSKICKEKNTSIHQWKKNNPGKALNVRVREKYAKIGENEENAEI